ncbi:hypothetical protein [Sediminitomix flava]|uniref:Uncharacterized protein n=1 Tax=Sediminitomix flava TaxID=379075 RepID=A0A315Z8T4_SEDFL|nr:hypothetical protein [Sediminitomix flava]PWJ41975.1 hypothetical protein BC781_103225 [Sediminitomix flava]
MKNNSFILCFLCIGLLIIGSSCNHAFDESPVFYNLKIVNQSTNIYNVYIEDKDKNQFKNHGLLDGLSIVEIEGFISGQSKEVRLVDTSTRNTFDTTPTGLRKTFKNQTSTSEQWVITP